MNGDTADFKPINRETAIENLKKYVGQDLGKFAFELGITTFETGKQNKGWKGLVLERLAGLEPSSSNAPNGILYELKSVSFHFVRGELTPKETMAITMINPAELRMTSFFESHCWTKLRSMVFCAVMWHGKDSVNAELLKVTSLDLAQDDKLIEGIKADYDFVREKLIEHGFESLTGRDGTWIQARTKGRGHGSRSRAFYARKPLVKKIFERAS